MNHSAAVPENAATSVASPRVGFSFARVQAIATNTFTESVRQKVFYVLIIVGLVILASSNLITAFSFQGKVKVVKDLGLAIISGVGTIIAIIGTAQYLPIELERKTIYTILSKPAHRFEFLLGKYLGIVILLFITVTLMSLLMSAVLLARERSLIADETRYAYGDKAQLEKETAKIRAQIRDPQLLKAMALTFLKLCLIAALALFVSTFSSSMIFTVLLTTMIFLCGHLVSTGKEYFGREWGTWVIVAFSFIPDLNVFNVADDIFLGKALPMMQMLKISVYGCFWIAASLFASYLVFQNKEI